MLYWISGSLIVLCLTIWAGFWFERWTRKQAERNEKIEKPDYYKAVMRANFKEKR